MTYRFEILNVLLIQYLTFVPFSQPVEVPCSASAVGHLFVLTPDCHLLTAPVKQANQLAARLTGFAAAGPCDVALSGGPQRPIALITKDLATNATGLHLLYHSPAENALRLTSVSDDFWKATEVRTAALDTLPVTGIGITGPSHSFDSCVLAGSQLRCYWMEGTGAELRVLGRQFRTGHDAAGVEALPEISIPAASIAEHIPLLAYLERDGHTNFLFTHVMKWLWRTSDRYSSPTSFGVVRVPIKSNPASMAHFATPLSASSSGVVTVVCDRKSAGSTVCDHHFTDFTTSHAQCLLRARQMMLVGFIPAPSGSTTTPMPRLKKHLVRHKKQNEEPPSGTEETTTEAPTTTSMPETTTKAEEGKEVVIPENHADGNETMVIEAGGPIDVRTDVKLMPQGHSDIWPIIIVAIIFGVILLIIIIFLCCLFCCIRRQQDSKEKEAHFKVPEREPKGMATKSDIERVLVVVNEALRSRGHQRDENAANQVAVPEPAKPTDSEKKGKIKVRVTLNEDDLKDVTASKTTDGSGTTSMTRPVSASAAASPAGEYLTECPTSNNWEAASRPKIREDTPKPRKHKLERMMPPSSTKTDSCDPEADKDSRLPWATGRSFTVQKSYSSRKDRKQRNHSGLADGRHSKENHGLHKGSVTINGESSGRFVLGQKKK
ncbi:unnamed protein product, partial [Mesorhabditis spiculigera]